MRRYAARCCALLMLLGAHGSAFAADSWRETCPQCGDGALPTLLLRLSEDDLAARLDAIAAIGAHPSPLATEPLVLLLKHDQPAMRRAAALALTGRSDAGTVAALIEATHDRFQSVRLVAMGALGRLPLPTSRARLAEVLADSSHDATERRAALDALAKHGTREAKAALQTISDARATTSTDPLSAAIAAAATTLMPCATCVEPQRTKVLTELLHPDAQHRLWAVHNLATLDVPTPDKVRLLRASVADPAAEVRERTLQEVDTLAVEHEAAADLLVSVALGEDGVEARLQRQARDLLTSADGKRADALVAAGRRAAQTPAAQARLVALLGSIRDDRAAAALATLAEHASTEQTRDAALALLGARNSDAGRAALATLATRNEESLATAAAQVALRYDIDVPPARLAALLRARPTMSPMPVLATLRTRKARDGYAPWTPVFEVLLRHPQGDVRDEALRLLVAAPAPSGAETFALVSGALRDAPNADAAQRYYSYLVDWQPRGLDELQRQMLANSNTPPDVRAHALGQIVMRHPEETAALLARFRDDPQSEVSRLARGLAATGGGAALASTSAPLLLPSPRLEPGALGDVTLALPETPVDGRWPLVFAMSALGATAFGNVASLAESSDGTRTLAFTLGG
ncbi:MAG: HEAT repeat domain-containing protein, partial [Myxococcota bacterium]